MFRKCIAQNAVDTWNSSAFITFFPLIPHEFMHYGLRAYDSHCLWNQFQLFSPFFSIENIIIHAAPPNSDVVVGSVDLVHWKANRVWFLLCQWSFFQTDINATGQPYVKMWIITNQKSTAIVEICYLKQ